MSNPTPQQYANLADDAYNVRVVTGDKGINIGGRDYKVIAVHANPRNGYYGAVYQDVQTNAVIVAHRGTERLSWNDWYTNAGMVANKINNQAADAEELTQKAFKAVDKFHKDTGKPRPTITQTGHSLGGNHAQTQAYRHNQQGVTFNPYGAAGMHGVPEGGNNVTNYMKATDPVAAAAPHYGKTILLATPDEISNLRHHGYTSGRHDPSINTTKAATVAMEVLKVHQMNNFTGPQSVLNNPSARALAEQEKDMIGDYRNDVEQTRASLHQGIQNYKKTRELIDQDPNMMSHNGFAPYTDKTAPALTLNDMPQKAQELCRQCREHYVAFHQAHNLPFTERMADNVSAAIGAEAYLERVPHIQALHINKQGIITVGHETPAGDLTYASLDVEKAAATPVQESIARAKQAEQVLAQQDRQLEVEIAQYRAQSQGMSYG